MALAGPDGASDRRVADLSIAGLDQRVLLASPAAPRAVLVMLPGGAGAIGIRPDGTLAHGANFLVRTRARFMNKGFAVLIPDAAGTRNLRGRRSTPAYGDLVRALAAYAGSETGAPVFLVGTSQGAIAAANGAARAQPGAVAGLVLTEAVSDLGGSRESVFDVDLAAVRVPVLIVANRDDACPVSPPAAAPRIAAALAGAPSVTVENVAGGMPGKACGSLSPHGYRGIEGQVVDLISAWIDARLAAFGRQGATGPLPHPARDPE
ncbi:lipase family protein [Xanthobacter tagetidis]|nr:lipase family protein [Xanthobacter tagetidis]MBB6306644.1 pimeloyl-ACP methyl ester carboxylesterase [Xanthobacter tagetidis]